MPEFDQAYFHVNLSLLVWNGGQGLKGGPGMSAGATRSAEGLFPFWKIQQVTGSGLSQCCSCLEAV